MTAIDIDIKRLPKHIAIIMDGNGRWATNLGRPRAFGHRRGAARVSEIVRAAPDLGIKTLTLYAFSTENWNRPKLEIDFLMQLLLLSLKDELKNLNKNMSKLLKEPELHQLICHQTLENELLWEKFENLANLLIITTEDINALFPGYEDFFRRDNVLGSLTTMERLSRVKGINDLVNMLAPFITRNHIRSGSFVAVSYTHLRAHET
mgnify:CR=1 FL=1